MMRLIPRRYAPPETIVSQLAECGAVPYLTELEWHEKSISAKASPEILTHLATCASLQCGILHLMHPEIGWPRTEYRSHRNAYGKGSLQMIVNTADWRFYADVDKFSPYEDVVGAVGHLGEVLHHWMKRWF